MNLEIYAPTKRLKAEKADTIVKLNRVEALVEIAPRTSHDISKLMGFSITGGGLYLNTLYYDRRVHISGWDGAGSNALPVFAIGDGQDVPRPKAASKFRVRDPRYRAVELTQEEQDLVNLKNWVPHRDPLVAAFFGSR